MKKFLGPMMLLMAALIWGSSFIVMKNAVDFFTPSTLLFVRFALASLFLTIIYFKQLKTFPQEKIKGGLITGCCLFSAYYVQTRGLALTTPGKNAFLTAVYCAIVPFLSWLFYHKKPDSYNFIAAFLCVVGIGFVSLDSSLSINLGDLLTLVGGFLYAIHILFIKKYSKDVDSGAFTALQFYGGTILALIISCLFEDITIISLIKPEVFLQIFYLAFFATALCMLFQTKGQQTTNECNASLILSLESVFGVLFSVLFYGEVLTLKVIIGFVIIFIAIVISETKLSFFKNKIAVSLVLCLLFSGLSVSNVQAEENWNLNAPYAYVYDASTNQTLYSKNGDSKIYPASMTKVMTALVALEHIKDLSQVITIADYDLEGLWEAGASTANLAVGEKVTYRDLIYGIILPSGADACRATARSLFGSEENMVKEMNNKAKELGLTHTHFVNTTGLHNDNHYTSVHDMAMITKTALKNDFFREVFSTRSYRTETTQHFMAASILKLHWSKKLNIDHIVGCKTGYTSQSKSCLTALVKSQNQDIVCVFAKESGSAKYVEDAKTVMNYCNKNYKTTTLYKKDDVIDTISIKDGVKDQYEIKLPSNVNVFMNQSASNEDFSVSYKGVEEVVAPTNIKDQLGKIEVKQKDAVLYEINVSMEESIDATTFAKVCRFLLNNFLYIILGILVFLIFLAYFIRWIIRRKRRKERRRKKAQMRKRGY